MGDRAGAPAGAVGRVAAGLDPGSFSFVMATGIVSIGMRGHRPAVISTALLWLAVAGYVVLVVLTCWRAAAFRTRMRADFADPSGGFAFFTFVAGTDVLGAALGLIGHRDAALALLVVGGLSWLVLGYAVPWAAILGRGDRPVLAGANGTWFVWVVASQSIAVLAAELEPAVKAPRPEFALLAVVCWVVGVFLYAAVGIFVAARMVSYPLSPADLTSPYWVAMGATAITVVAGARIVDMAGAPAAAVTHGMVAAVSVGFWAFGTWLIPPLVAAGWWRHVRHRVPLRYDTSLWSIVFPLGMYSVAGRSLGQADHLPIVAAIGRNAIWVALAAWTLTFAGLLTYLGSHRRMSRHITED
ncbi:MAG TPA: tellurite resistance/C4-dicarboxylate transporter family protein [Streptosporangiaceae bacterium]